MFDPFQHAVAAKPPSPQYPHYRDEYLTFFSGQWGQAAINLWVLLNPSVNWANKQAEAWRGLPFGPYLRASRPRRERSLTGPLDRSGASIWSQILSSTEPEQQTNDQLQCSLLMRLPIDIRIMIYELVLGHRTFHLSAGDPHSRILHHVCKVPHRIDEQIHGQCHDFSAGRPSSSRSTDVQHWSEVATGLLPLLCTCRRIYSEAIQTLYSSNVFEFTQNFAAFRFLKLIIPPARLRDIRCLRLFMRIPRHPDANGNSHRDWRDLWDFFETEMTGLKTLHLRLAMLEPMEQRIRDTADSAGSDWIEPMVLMAMASHRKRGCKVEIVTGQASMVTDLVRVFKHVAYDNQDLGFESLIRLACARVHERVRFSMGGLG
ncbi:hypothetical protein K431DRAFT_300674 [Polychaeton citri CBS 116435]|uniref:DUF7730 domain-containing protein n=1 Tax=Polychaeton citri CBS 116435 TaxID=1314669 RepID=A0A9P4UU48_9PEZI|nr:hypothetical protein K431DRAFT_300674 [Polychaeton citri CBS 116435]